MTTGGAVPDSRVPAGAAGEGTAGVSGAAGEGTAGVSGAAGEGTAGVSGGARGRFPGEAGSDQPPSSMSGRPPLGAVNQ